NTEENDVLPYGKNLFLDMIERISREFNISNCWVCGGTKVTEIWPWEGISLRARDILKWMKMKKDILATRKWEGQWKLRARTIGEECIWRKG
ncbi:ENR1 protein, partial [Orthonyx spaldingii]|nr:ENR1 protein [Orthonyx spaldingii]